MFAGRLQLHQVHNIDNADFQFRNMLADQFDGGQRFQRRHVAAAAEHDVGLVALVAVVGLAKIESKPIEDGVKAAGFPASAVGVIIALLVLLPETLAAVRAAQRGRVVSKAQILTRVWGYTDYDPNLVEVHVSALRRKLGEPRLVHTVRGLGYVLRTAPAAATFDCNTVVEISGLRFQCWLAADEHVRTPFRWSHAARVALL